MRVARVYDAPGPETGVRVLVDRLWPRGLRKDDPRIDQWRQAVAPSADLRRWYGHRPELFAEFAGRYEQELAQGHGREALDDLYGLVRGGPVILLTATKDVEHSHAVVLAQLLSESG
ncbi:hypothetical protein Pth03_31470 [Planotetraspora thailandica]|uniref:MarR family transcriptional regulator n=1 Tax=Planotetraspora thailandica TaxID=487172 RepID=A0A8J3V0V1_9ACTN|nr:hypothetical protein Pth03_31470 [Planotetraspora thailandica]